MNYLKRTINIALALPLIMGASHAVIAADEGVRISTTSQGLASPADTTAERKSSRDEYGALETSGDRNTTARTGGQQKTSGNEMRTPNTDFWFYTADVELFTDRDRDGYYAGIDLLFDADTYYDVAEVYAVIYLSYEYGPWNEYAETDNFTIFGASSGDEYIVETDLVAGYPTGHYDILIELYDAYDNAFVAEIGPEDTSELSLLPLEDSTRDAPGPVTTQVVVSSGGGGSLGWFLLLGLAAAGAVSRKG
ncbi:MAG: choice-of-anchor H family protein [Gammaproteobacteria bacterium]|nr:choice-of-anchor H family protein [Gammaproteobacteria bacterium]MDH3362586.1 choice-of-anchor H family protein [Gammaproteobacteria bacterium]MDH3480541.1 choice-of-anchor H family protein [Gammaproteobacteria bacterium]